MAATDEEDEVLYENLNKKNSYDEITMNFGRPVIQIPDPKEDDIFASISFSSPIEDLKPMTPPIPAPRLSKQKSSKQILPENEDQEVPKEPPQPPPRNVMLKPEHLYSEIEIEELGARPRYNRSSSIPTRKSCTIDIRNTISQWYDEASEEIERDLSLDLTILEETPNIAEHDQQQQNVPALVAKSAPTLLRDFDPILSFEDIEETTEEEDEEEPSEAMDELKDAECQESTSDEKLQKSENFYVAVPFSSSSRTSRESTPSPSPPKNPPPPPPPTASPPAKQKLVSYENIWLEPSSQRPILENKTVIPPPVPPRLKPKQPSFLGGLTSNEDSAISSSASSSSNDVHVLSSTPSTPQRSFSALNLATKFASNIKRKMSDQNIVQASRPSSTTPQLIFNKRRSSYITSSPSHLKTKSGVLYVYSRSRRSFQPKWCVLDHADFKYFNDKQTVAIPKETVTIKSILSLSRFKSVTYNSQQVEIYTFNIAYMTNKHHVLSLGAATPSERDKWMDKIVHSLDYKLPGMGPANKLCLTQLKTGFAGIWHKSWLSIDHWSNCTLKYTEDYDNVEEVSLKKIKNITLVKDVKNLAAPISQTLPILVIDCLDRSLYLQCHAEKEAFSLKEAIESVAFVNPNILDMQQLTAEDIPVIVDKCISFVYGHGCMTEGIYRHSGVNTKINKLLELFRTNAWAVHLTRESFSEHDVANALKRFFRTLSEPLLTEKLRPMFLQAAAVEDLPKKVQRYRNLVQLLPGINFNTLKKLMSHLVAIASHAGKNLMPNYNLGAIWGPSLLTVDSMTPSNYEQTSSESDVCRDLIDNYKSIFDVADEELEKEAKISEVLEKISKYDRGRCLLKRSGDLRLWVYVDTKSSGNCVCVLVKPNMTAQEMTEKVLTEKNLSAADSCLVLHEVVMGGALQRPIHHSELVLDVTLKWGSWGEQERRDNYLLLKRNILYEEALNHAIPPLSVFGEAMYSDLKMKSFKKYMLSMSNARLTINKNEGSVELASWPIEDISWYLGSEQKRQPPFSLNMTVIHRNEDVIRSKDRPHFGHTVSFESRDFYIKWIAAMLVAEHVNNLHPSLLSSSNQTEEDNSTLVLID